MIDVSKGMREEQYELFDLDSFVRMFPKFSEGLIVLQIWWN